MAPGTTMGEEEVYPTPSVSIWFCYSHFLCNISLIIARHIPPDSSKICPDWPIWYYMAKQWRCARRVFLVSAESSQSVSLHDLVSRFWGLFLQFVLSAAAQPPIAEIVELGVVPTLVQFLYHDNSALQLEAAWCLTNVASGTSEQTMAVVNAGGIPAFVHILKSPDEEVREQAVWAMGNISGDSAANRDAILATGALDLIIQYARPEASLTYIRNSAWTISNLCRGRPPADFNIISKCIPLLAQLIYSDDQDTLVDSLWATSYVSDGATERIQAILSVNTILPRAIEFLSHHDDNIVVPALRIIGNIVTGDGKQTQMAIDANCIPLLNMLATHKRVNIRREAIWSLSNIAAGTREQIHMLLKCGVGETLLNAVRNEESNVQKEAIWAVANAVTCGDVDCIAYLVQLGAIKALCAVLTNCDHRVQLVGLEGLENIIKGWPEANGPTNHYITFCEEEGLVEILYHIQENAHDMKAVQKAQNMLDTFFPDMYDEGGIESDDNYDATEFQFGMDQGNTEGGAFQPGSNSWNFGN